MRKKLLSFAALAAIVFFGACSNEELLPEPEQTFTFSASMPQKKSPTSSIALNDPTTRVALDEVDKDIVLTWEEGDAMSFVVTQNGNTAVGTTTVTPGTISNGGKKALFSPSIPGGLGAIDINQPFNFYGVYGGGGLSSVISTNALLPVDPSASGSLDEVQNNEDVMLYFAHENVLQSDLVTGVTLNHLGSLFKITVRNNCPTGTLNLENARLFSAVGDANQAWAYDFNTAETVFDLTTQTFKNTGTGINFMPFSTNTATIAPTEEAEYWRWYPVLEDNTWPELNLMLEDANPGDLITLNSKTRTTPIVVGKNYRFYAAFDGTNLNFTNSDFSEVTP